MVRDKIVKALQKATGEKDVELASPEVTEHGDYSTNVAMQTAGTKNPHEIAEGIVKKLEKDRQLAKIIAKIEVAGPGFINFWLSQEFLAAELPKINQNYGQSDINKGKKVMFEYGDANTHKLPHIGHLFSYIYGESMVRIMEASGWEIRRASYQGDIGPHVAKCLWALDRQKPKIPGSLIEKVYLLQKMYQEGSRAYDEDEEAKEAINQINRQIYAGGNKYSDLWQQTRQWSIDYYQQFEKRLGINYDKYYFESEVQEKGKKIVEENVGRIFKKSQGALIFEGSKYGLHDRVFVTGFGTPMYEAKDMYLQELKFKQWPADLLIISTAHEQNEYFKVVFKALEILHPDYQGKLKHIGFGMVNLKSGKMSSRTGNIIGGIELVDAVVEKVKEFNEEEKTAEVVGVGAVKYSFLKNNPLQDTKFDLEESIAAEGNSGPYLQYTAARTRSVLGKAGSQKLKAKKPTTDTLNVEELAVLRTLPKFPEVVAAAAEAYAPNLICNYLFDLAQKFNTFYNKHRILKTGTPGVSEFRLALTRATGQILASGLNLLGIEAPSKM